MKEKYISHLYRDAVSGEWIIQTNEEHSLGVAELASRFTSDFGLTNWGYALGLLHDKGKERNSFQSYIKKSSGYDESAKWSEDHSHAFVGALFAKKLYPKEWGMLLNPLAGHHRGLYDKGDLVEIMKKSIPSEIDLDVQVLPKLETLGLTSPRYQASQLIRMLFSCLVDADYLDTERFMDLASFESRQISYSLKPLLSKLEIYLTKLKETSSDTPVNRVRNTVQRYARKESDRPSGIFEMTVPTGGGKTLSSILWALRHAVHNGLKRIVIAIPYTSIIEQTAEILKIIFGEESVLEHHSQVSIDEIEDQELRLRTRLASENWDYPIIVTTNVRLFESILNHRPSKCRRLHNLAKSVIILDEVQTLPIEYYTPILTSLETLNKIFGSSILMTTASQPLLWGEIKGCNPYVKCTSLTERPISIVPHDEDLQTPLKRVDIQIDSNSYSYDEIAEVLMVHDCFLCIVNTRKVAKEIFLRLQSSYGKEDDSLIHLSKAMCPSHIKSQLGKIKKRLQKKEPVRVISTQLIEAGVDVDFPVVFRQEAGLDSIIQAAGRCNREGQLDGLGKTIVFELAEENTVPSGFLSKGNNARKEMSSSSDWFSNDAMTEYFRRVHSKIDTFDNNEVFENLNISKLNFETASNCFRYIDDSSVAVIVDWENSFELVELYKKVGPSYGIFKKLNQYSVSISEYNLRKLAESGAVEELGSLLVVTDSRNYDEKVGLTFENNWIEETLII